MTPDIVDSCLFYLLNAIDEGFLNVSFRTAGDKMIDLTVDGRGELGGCYMDSQGWRSMYSKERVVDVFAD